MLNPKKKGNLWENKWADWLSSHGIRAWRDSASGGGSREKTDVGNTVDYSFQVKAVKRLNLLEAWRQAKKDSELVHHTPAVVVHFDGMADDEFLVVLNNYDWLDLFLGEGKDTTYTDPKLKWAITTLIEAAKSVLKKLPK